MSVTGPSWPSCFFVVVFFVVVVVVVFFLLFFFVCLFLFVCFFYVKLWRPFFQQSGTILAILVEGQIRNIL